MKRLLILLLGFMLSLPAFTQQKFSPHKATNQQESAQSHRNIWIIGRNYGDSVVLRWAPALPTLWHFANESGYRIIRYEAEQKHILFSTKKILTQTPVRPWSLDEWKQNVSPQDSLAAVCAQILYGKTLITMHSTRKNAGINLKEALNEKYELENEQGMALFLADQSPVYATGLGLRYTDKSFVKGKAYVYAVYALTNPGLVKSDTSAVLINTGKIMPVPRMPKVTIETLDRNVKFSWNRMMAGMYFSGYYYERSDDGGKTFKQLNRRPYNQLTTENKPDLNSTIVLYDSLPRNYKLYYYRITGITPFGDRGVPSPNLPVMGRDLTPPSPPEQLQAKNTKGKMVRLTWIKKTKEPDFSGYLVGRSDKASGPFVPLTLKPISPFIDEFTDTAAFPHGTNYYIVSAIDTAGNAGASVPAYVIMTDTIPPAQPEGLTGTIDTTGIVHLRWHLGKEPDLMGYLVYSANAPDHRFVPVSHDFVADTTFTDSITLHTLTPHIYYKIVAFDRNRNPSKYSDALELKRPDKVAPVTPVFTGFNVTDTSVVMTWATSPSSDVSVQHLYRKENGRDWKLIRILGKEISSYTDPKVKRGMWYEYTLEAVDRAGLHSPRSFPLNVRVYDSGARPRIRHFTIIRNKDGKSLHLSWEYPEKENFWFELFRSVDGTELMTYKSFSSKVHTFTDTDVKKATYQYAIKAVYNDGGESPQEKSERIRFLPSEP